MNEGLKGGEGLKKGGYNDILGVWSKYKRQLISECSHESCNAQLRHTNETLPDVLTLLSFLSLSFKSEVNSGSKKEQRQPAMCFKEQTF